MTELLPLRHALRTANPFPIEAATIDECLDEERDEADALFRRARAAGLAALAPNERPGHLWRVVGEDAESVAELLLAKLGYNVFWHITEPGVHGVDLLLLTPDDAVLALEVKGTLRAGAIPRLTPSHLRQMSRDWLNQPDNPAMVEWELEADDIYGAIMIVDLALTVFRVAVSSDFEAYTPIRELSELDGIRGLAGPYAG